MDLKLENKNDLELALKELIASVIIEIYKTLKSENLIETHTLNISNNPNSHKINKNIAKKNSTVNQHQTTSQNMDNNIDNSLESSLYGSDHGTMKGNFLNNDRNEIGNPFSTSYTGRYYSNMRKHYIHWKKSE
ncbi:MAG: hypothetical protein AB7G87_07675 [Clostridia bacterium]